MNVKRWATCDDYIIDIYKNEQSEVTPEFS